MIFSTYQRLHETIPELYPIAICNFLGILPLWPYEPTKFQTRNPLQAFILPPAEKIWMKVPITQNQYNKFSGMDTVIPLLQEPLFVENIKFTVVPGHNFSTLCLKELILFGARESIALPLDNTVWVHMPPEDQWPRRILWWPKNSLQTGIDNIFNAREKHRASRKALGIPLAERTSTTANRQTHIPPDEEISRILHASHRRSF